MFVAISIIWDTSVGIASGYVLDGGGSFHDRGKTLFSTSQRPDRLQGPLRLLSNGYRKLLPRR
jgi:hypothetical protein